MKKIKQIACVAIVALVGTKVGAVRANSIEIGGVTTSISAGVWDYSYTMMLTKGNSVSSTISGGASLFVFYDLLGLTGAQATFTSGATSSSDWNIVIQNTSGNWSGGFSSIVSQGGTAVEPDSASLPNVLFQYVGSGLDATSANVILGTVDIFSTEAPTTIADYAARWVADASGNTQINTDTPLAPGPGGVGAPPPSVPVPAALWTGLASLAALGVLARFRKTA